MPVVPRPHHLLLWRIYLISNNVFPSEHVNNELTWPSWAERIVSLIKDEIHGTIFFTVRSRVDFCFKAVSLLQPLAIRDIYVWFEMSLQVRLVIFTFDVKLNRNIQVWYKVLICESDSSNYSKRLSQELKILQLLRATSITSLFIDTLLSCS